MSTSVTRKKTTHPSQKRFKKAAISYTLLTIFFFAFSRIYESLSYGETSVYMHYLFAAPLIGGVLLLAILKVVPATSRLTLNLWNSGVAVVTAGLLLKGIITLSGRSTTLDMPYYYVAAGFFVLAVIAMMFTRSVWVEEI